MSDLLLVYIGLAVIVYVLFVHGTSRFAIQKLLSSPILLLFLISLTFSITSKAQIVSVGQGSYTRTYPQGNSLPSGIDGEFMLPRVSQEFDQIIQSNDYWSNLIFPHQGSDHLDIVPAHPLVLKSSENGFEVGYLEKLTTSSRKYYYSARNFIEIGIGGKTSNRTSAHGYGDWTFAAKMEYENASLIATTGHGLPYTFFDINGGDVSVTSKSDFTIWHSVDEVIGISIDGIYYALFAPEGSTWSGTDTLTSSLNGKGFLSVAVLPDPTSETLEFFRSHAYAQVTNSRVDWDYNEISSNLTSTFTYETVLRDSANGNSNETVTALYRHQWINTNDVLTNYSYVSPRGEMKVFVGNSFSTTTRFSGILPSLPDLGDYNRLQLLEFVQEASNDVLDASTYNNANTYNSGKQMGRFAELVHIADQIGAISERDYFLSQLKNRLEDWFTLGGDQFFYYDENWNALFGYPGSYGSSTELNDHHFHWSYFIKSAATIAQFDREWASQDNWGGMVNLIIKDANNWDREDEMLPFLRNFDSYAGHAWASGHANYDFAGAGLGNNQEASSESMNFATASILWGEITGQDDIRDLGIFLYTNENEAIDQYWFDVDEEVFPAGFPRNVVGRVWSDGADYTTWFGDEPEFIHGINFIPINAGSFYLAKHPDFIIENYNEIVSERGGQPIYWNDLFWQYLSMSNADLALLFYLVNPDYAEFDGESKAHTMHWLYNMREMGRYNTEVTANIPTYAVFVTASGDTTYTAYNAESTPRLVSFSDGFSMEVPANSMQTHQTGERVDAIPPAPVPTIESNLVMSIFSDSYPNITNVNLNPPGQQNTIVTVELFDGNNTLKYDFLDYQSIDLDPLLDVQSRNTFHIDYYTSDATSLQLTLIANNGTEAVYDFSITSDEWQRVEIPFTSLPDLLDLTAISSLFFTGNGTVYLDNIYFSGDTPVDINPIGDAPNVAAPTPIHEQENVISIFSDSYIDLPNTKFNPNWNQQTIVSFVEIEENNTLKYANLNYQGTQLENSIDVTEMDFFHVDYWTKSTTPVQIFLISPGPVETPFTIEVEQNSWQSIEIPLSEYSQIVNLSEVFQLKIVGDGILFLDNLYFYKSVDVSIEEDDLGIPKELELSQNYPNPFNPSTNIEVSIPEASAVSLIIYNSIGQRVSTILDSQLSAGKYTYSWDASNVSSGIYFYQLKSNNSIITKQLLLIK
jgi:endoglucanase Acf2